MNTIESAGTANVSFLEELFEQYQHDPASVSPDWREYFESLGRAPVAVAPGSAGNGQAVDRGRPAGGGQAASLGGNGRSATKPASRVAELVAPDGIPTGHAVAVANGEVRLPDAPAGEDKPLPLPATTSAEERLAFLQDRVDQLVRAYRVRGPGFRSSTPTSTTSPKPTWTASSRPTRSRGRSR